MQYIKTLLKKLMDAPGLSGFETPVADLIRHEWEDTCDEVTVSKVGSLHGLKKGAQPVGHKAKSVLIAAHMDAIGMMVTELHGSFLRFTDVGGIDPRILPGTPVTVYCSGHGEVIQRPGVIASPHPRAMAPTNGSIPMNELLVDLGMVEAELKSQVQIGDLISFNTHPMEHGSDVISGHSADNRASVTALSTFLRNNKNRQFGWDVLAVATSQEETNFAGAYTSSRSASPDLAIVIDVTFAKGPGSNDWKTYASGKGITLGLGPNIHTGFMRKVKSIAEEIEIPISVEPMPKHSGTDAYAVQVANAGIPTIVIGIPLKYMHTPVEMVNITDIKRTAKLLEGICSELDDKFLKKIAWDHEENDGTAED